MLKHATIVTLALLAACKGGAKKETPPAGAAGSSGSAGSSGTAVAPTPPAAAPAAAPAAKLPTGTIAGKPFAPTVALLLENSDGGKLGFYQMPADRRDRKRCEEPMGSASEREMTLYHPIDEWKLGTAVVSTIDDWGVTGVGFGDKHPGAVKVTLTTKDPATFKLAGTIELKADDGSWRLAGAFDGEYCPTKVVVRGDDAALAGMAWTKDAVDPAKLPTTPVQAVIAGRPATIAHATLREVGRYDGGKPVRRQELAFFAEAPSDPCAPRSDGETAFKTDNFGVWLPAVPTAGARLAGVAKGDVDKVDQIAEAELEVFEPDGTRGWRYVQYFSAALAIDTVDDKQVTGRVFVALPDQGKSMLAGAFTAVRCPPVP